MDQALVIIPAGALAIGILVTWLRARRQGWRWGATYERTAEVGDGPFRSASVALATPRRMPVACAAAATTSVAWGVLTLAVFVPAGLIACLMSLDRLLEFPAMVGIIWFGLMIANGVVHGRRLIKLVTPLTNRTRESSERVRRAAVASLVHHVLVCVSFVSILPPRDALDGIWIAGGPCAIGVVQALLLLRAYVLLARFDREDAAPRPDAPVR